MIDNALNHFFPVESIGNFLRHFTGPRLIAES